MFCAKICSKLRPSNNSFVGTMMIPMLAIIYPIHLLLQKRRGSRSNECKATSAHLQVLLTVSHLLFTLKLSFSIQIKPRWLKVKIIYEFFGGLFSIHTLMTFNDFGWKKFPDNIQIILYFLWYSSTNYIFLQQHQSLKKISRWRNILRSEFAIWADFYNKSCLQNFLNYMYV